MKSKNELLMDIQKEIDRLKFENKEHQAIIKVSKDCITANNRKIRKLETTLEVVKEIVKHEEFDPASGKMVEKIGEDITEVASSGVLLTAVEQRQIEEQ